MSRLGNEDGVGRDLSRPDSTVSGGDFGVTGGTTEHAVLLSTLGGTVCGSKVGDKGKFCIKLRGLCNVESHKAMERKDGVYLLAGTDKCWEKGGELGDAPLSVRMGVNNVLYRDLSREEWMAVIAAINEVQEADTQDAREALIENFEKVVANLVCHHPQPHEVTEDNVSEVERLKAESKTTPMKSRGYTSSFEEASADLAGLDALERVTMVNAEMIESFGDCNRSISDTQMALKKVAAGLGKVGSEDPPLREMVRNMDTKLRGLVHSAENLGQYQETYNQNHVNLMKRVDTVELNLEGLVEEGGRMEELEEAFEIQANTLNDVFAEVTGLKSKLVNGHRVNTPRVGYTARASTLGAAGSVPAQSLAALERRIAAFEASQQSGPPTSSGLAALEARVAKIDKQISVSGDTTVVSLESNRWVFKGRDGASDWLAKAGVPEGCDDFGFDLGLLVQDPLHMLAQASSNGSVTEEAFQQKELHAAKVGGTAYATSYSASAQSMLPACFTTKGGTQLSKLKTYEDWNAGDGEQGIGVVLEKALRETREQEYDRVNSALCNYPELRELATYLVTSSIDFLDAFFTWIDKYYRVMVKNTGATNDKEKGECWRLVLTMVYTVFEVLWETRRPAKNAYLSARRDGLVTCLYSAVRTQSVMKEFQRHHFSEHDRIFPKLMTYIFESHASKVQFVSMKKTIDSAVNKVDALQKTMDGVLNRLKALERGGAGGAGGGDGGKWQARKGDKSKE